MQTISVLTISRESRNENTERNAVLFGEIAEPDHTTVFSTSENPAYGDIPNGPNDFYFNEGMGGLAELKMTQCKAYEPQPISNTMVSTSDYTMSRSEWLECLESQEQIPNVRQV